MYWHLILRNYPLKLLGLAARQHGFARGAFCVIRVVHLFFSFRVEKLRALRSKVYSDFHIWDVRYQIVKRA